MKNLNLLIFPIIFIFLQGCLRINPAANLPGSSENYMYDGPEQAARFEFERTKNPATGKLPPYKYLLALQQTNDAKEAMKTVGPNSVAALTWQERGPNRDSTGASNGNTRANNGISSGRIRAIMVDSTDATHNSVWIGGVDGGLWKTNDITASPATWTVVNDNLSNLAIAAICQDPRPGFQNNLYFCTGESYGNIDGVQGNGVFKSADGGTTWSYLASTAGYAKGTRILCDYLGNVYLATKSTGLLRSTDGGSTWTNITPSGMVSDICDLEISSTSAAGRLHVVSGIFTTQAYRYTDVPATVSSGAGWNAPATAFPSYNDRTEICCSGNTLYALVADGSYQVPTIYKSTDGGGNWAATGSQPTSGWASGQGWYALACDIDPASSGNTCIVGGLDTWKTTNGGTTWSQISTWVGTSPVNQYVHADVHKILFSYGNLFFASDGGMFYSNDKGTTIRDRNSGLRIKQFYSCAIHPSTTNYFLAGAQDNGVHQFFNAGLSNTAEVTGGDGAFVAIDQNEPLYQYGSYVYSNYRVSTDGGVTWSSVNFGNTGQFINPIDFDNTANIMYCGDGAGVYRRWTDPHTGSTSALISITALGSGSVTAVSVSPYTANRVYFGTNGGKVVQVDNANSIASGAAGTDLSAGLPGGTVSCINPGTTDQYLILCESNYGINNTWVSTNGGTSWTAIDGNLPDMPVRWCMFYPGDNTKAYIATETGVWETTFINGASTVWTANATFPTVRTDMLKYRASDRTLVAATHGRGLWTTTIPNVSTPDLQFQSSLGSATETTTFITDCRGYTDYNFNMVILNPPTGTATVTLSVAGGSTATQNVDYAVTTNGNFAAPSMVLTFPSGSTNPQPYTIRVYDDAAVESTESFTLNYTISGATDAQPGTSNQSFPFTIFDNDAVPALPSSLTQTWGAANVNSINSGPFNGSAYTDKRLQNLYMASDLVAAGFTAGLITDFAWNFNSATVATFNNCTISIGLTSASDLTGGFAATTLTTIYSGNFTTPGATGWRNFTLPVQLNWDGVSNIVIETCFDNSAVTTDVALLGTTLAGYIPTAMFRQNAAGSVCSTVANTTSTTRPDIRLGISSPGTAISAALSSTKTAYLGPFDDVYFYDASGYILARIKNLTAFDYGCTQVLIDRAGTASAQFWNNNPANYLTSKSFKVIPTNNTATGHYQITLYYTQVEVNGWQAATTQTFSSQQVVKVSNGFSIPDVTPSTPHVASVSSVPGLVSSFGINSTIMGDFNNTGFSGFAVGTPATPLPVTLTSFTGYARGQYGMLEWLTSAEYNNMGFDLEKSYDGINFTKIAFIAGAGTSNQPQHYAYHDNIKLTNIQYYRLKQTDAGQRAIYSNTVLIRLNGDEALDLLSVTNPFFTGLNLLFSRPPTGVLNIQLFDMNGREVYSMLKSPDAGGNQQMVFPAVFSPGSYVLRLNVDGRQFNKIIVKQ